MKEDSAIIIQARVGSSRLPGKIIMPFIEERSILQIIIENLLEIFPYNKIIVATTDSKKDNVISEHIKPYKVNLFRGDENDVLKRFIDCAGFFQVKYIVRICADNPFIIPHYVLKLFNESLPTDDYLSYAFPDKTPVIKSHIGLFGEYTNINALIKAYNSTNDLFFKEHVTNYLYTNPSFFNIRFLNLPDKISNRKDIRLTIDSIEDFENMKKLYKLIPNPLSENFLDSLIFQIEKNPEIHNVMINQIRRYEK